MPRCSKNGTFERIQCNNEILSSCWCVDDQGFEIPGTRAPAAGLVNCTGKNLLFLIEIKSWIWKFCFFNTYTKIYSTDSFQRNIHLLLVVKFD